MVSLYHHLCIATQEKEATGKGLKKNWNTRTTFQVYGYVLVQCSLVNLSKASTQELSLSLHCYYRGWLLLIITFL